jgi:hypothetical protein
VAPAISEGCNLSTAQVRIAVAVLVGIAALPRSSSSQTVGEVAEFFGGAAVGLALHESAHVVADFASGVSPGIKKVTFGPLPFFAITHEPVTPGREFVISSAGFWTQHAVSEYLLTSHPALRSEHAPVLKGILAFNILTSVAYSGAAFAQTGPAERDTRGMALSLRFDEPVIGAVLLAPAVLDAMRYFGTDNRWVVWGSRAAKVAGVLLIVRAVQ